MSFIATGKRIEESEVVNGRTSLAALLEVLAGEPGQWMEFEVTNASVSTQVKKNPGYDARTHKKNKGDKNDRAYILQACYVGPDFVATIIPKTRKNKSSAVPVTPL